MKLCKDCKHHRKVFARRVDLAKCFAPENMATSLVTGEQIAGATGYTFCDVMRLPGRECGVEARWFEPINVFEDAEKVRRPWWKFWGAAC